MLNFNASNWSTAQTVIVRGQNDGIADGNQSYLIVATATSTDPAFSNQAAQVSLVNFDDDQASVLVAAEDPPVTDEGGGSVRVAVALGSEPTAPVTVQVSTDDPTAASLSTTTLVFTSANWMTPQWITVTGLNDFSNGPARDYHISFATSSSDPVYQAMAPRALTITHNPVPNQAPGIVPPEPEDAGGGRSFRLVPTGWSNPIVGDPDAGTQLVMLTVSTNQGVLRMHGGLNLADGQVFQLISDLAGIEALLRTITLELPAAVPGTVQLTYELNDQGNTGTGGPLSSIVQRSLTVAAIAPTVTVGPAVTVGVNASWVLSPTDLNATDPVSAAAGLQYTITAVPERGVLQREGVALGLNAHFTQEDINQGRISFRASAYGVPVAFSFTVTNEAGAVSDPVTLSFNVLGVLPSVTAHGPITVPTGSIQILSATDLHATHPDAGDGEIRYTIVGTPAGGRWQVQGVDLADGAQFTQADVDAGRVGFRAAGGALSESLALTVSTPFAPGAQSLSLALQVTVAPDITITPYVTDAGRSQAITSASLAASHAGTPAEGVVYQIVAVPGQGELRLDGTLLAAGATFTQADVDNGRLTYRSAPGGQTGDALEFRLSTAGGPVSGDQTLAIQINAAGTPAFQVGPLTVMGGSTTVIGTAQLNANHAYLPPEALRYTIVAFSGEGRWELAGTTLVAGDRFTQADVSAGAVRYTAGSNATQAGLLLRVGSDYGPSSADVTLPVTIRVAPTLVAVSGFSTVAGFPAPVSPGLMHATHPEASAAQLVYELVAAPSSGQWRLNGTALTSGDRFTQADIDAGRVSFRSGTTLGQDQISVRVGTADGPSSSSLTIDIGVVAAPAPTLTTAPLGMIADQTRVVGADHLSASHSYLGPDALGYTILALTGEGHWSLGAALLGVGDHFTQADVDAGRISFQAGASAPSGSLSLRVGTAYGPAVAEASVAITVAVAPTVGVGVLEVEAGRPQTVTTAALTAGHPSAAADRIVYTLLNPPGQGQWLRDGQSLSAGQQFTQADLLAGRIGYLGSRPGSDSVVVRVTTPDDVPSAARSLGIQIAGAPAPVLTTAPIDVRAGQVGIIGSDALAAHHSYLGASDLIYTLMATSGEGHWALDGQTLTVGAHFTQADVAAGRLSFRAGTTEPQASVRLQVGTAFGPATAVQTLVARVDVMPQVQVGALAVPAAGLQVLTPDQLEVSYPEADPADVVFTVEQLPAQGELRLGGITLKVGDHFSQADVAAGQVAYQAAGAGGVADLVLSVDRADGGPSRSINLQIRVAAPPFVPPAPAPAPAPAAVSTTQSSTSSTSASASSAATANSGSGEGQGSAAVVAPPTTSRFASRGPEGGGEAAAAVVPVAAAKRGADGSRSDRDGYASSGEFERILFQGSALRNEGYGASMIAASLTDQGGGELAAPALRDALDAMSRRLREAAQIDRNLVASTAAVSAGVSIGYVIWMIRGGVLVSSMLASMPAWRSIDPFPVLDRGPQRGPADGEGGAGGGEDDSLAGMLDRARRDGLGGADAPLDAPADRAHGSAADHGPATSSSVGPLADGARGPSAAPSAPRSL